MLKFFDYLEANADQFWDVPQWLPGEAEQNRPGSTPGTSLGDELELEEEKNEEDDLFSAAYEDMVYRDSTADNIDANMLEAPEATIEPTTSWSSNFACFRLDWHS